MIFLENESFFRQAETISFDCLKHFNLLISRHHGWFLLLDLTNFNDLWFLLMNDPSSFLKVVYIDHRSWCFSFFAVLLRRYAASWIRTNRSSFFRSDWDRCHLITFLAAFRPIIRLRWVSLSRVFIYLIPVRAPVLPDKSSCLLEVSGKVYLLLASLNLRL
jgi:hypothetical protein